MLTSSQKRRTPASPCCPVIPCSSTTARFDSFGNQVSKAWRTASSLGGPSRWSRSIEPSSRACPARPAPAPSSRMVTAQQRVPSARRSTAWQKAAYDKLAAEPSSTSTRGRIAPTIQCTNGTCTAHGARLQRQPRTADRDPPRVSSSSDGNGEPAIKGHVHFIACDRKYVGALRLLPNAAVNCAHP